MSNGVVAEVSHATGRKTRLVNLSDEDHGGIRPIDRRSKFGNPFKLEDDGGEFTRRQSVEAYITWFEEKIFGDFDYRRSVHELRGETLGCWCVPELCHGHVILYYLDNAVLPDSVEELQEWRSGQVDCRTMHDES